MDADHVRNGGAPICTPSVRSPTLAGLAQAGDELGTQLTARHGVKRGVDRLVADLERRVVRLHAAQYALDLLRRMPIAQQLCEVAAQRAILGQTRWVSCRYRQPSYALLLRSVMLLLAYTTYFLAFPVIKLADINALYATVPLFVTALAGPFLGEKITWQRWAAVAVGFVGVLIMVRPGATIFELASLLPILSALAYATA